MVFFFAIRRRISVTPSVIRATPATAETTPTTIGVMSEVDFPPESVSAGPAGEELPGDEAGVGAGAVDIVGVGGVVRAVVGAVVALTVVVAGADGARMVVGVGGVVRAVVGAVVTLTVAGADGAEVGTADEFSTTAKKSVPPRVVFPHDPSVSPARTIPPADPTAKPLRLSSPAEPPCRASPI